MRHTHYFTDGETFTHDHADDGEHAGLTDIVWDVEPAKPSGPCSTKIHEDADHRIFLGSTGRITVEGKVTPRCPNAKPSWVVLWQSR